MLSPLTLTLAIGLAQAPASSCGVSDEPAFAITRDHAVQVGGGAMSEARQRRYLDVLRGPMGEAIQYKRTGLPRPEADGRTILDVYEVTYPGLAILITVLAINLIGDGLRYALDPKLKRS